MLTLVNRAVSTIAFLLFILIAAAPAHAQGNALAWGFNAYGQLGNGTTTGSSVPVQVFPGLSGVVGVAGGFYHSLAVKSDGTVWTWGSNTFGALGNGATADGRLPGQVTGVSGVVRVAGGVYHCIAAKSDGTVWSWGFNSSGQLGNGATTDSYVPVPVIGLSGVVQVAAGWQHSLAVKSNGTVWAWGLNNSGELGNGTTTNSSVPVKVTGLTGVVRVAGGRYHSLAVKSDGTVWAWGSNSYGELGNGTTISSRVPVQVTGLTGVVEVGGSHLHHSLAVKSDGSVWAWGLNDSGQLGNGTTISSSVPVHVTDISGAVGVAGGYGHSVALKIDGTVWAWGSNAQGQLGNGTTTNSTVPVHVPGVLGAVGVAAGYGHNLVSPPVADAVPLPTTPIALTATAGYAQVSLSWDASTGAAWYYILRSTTPGGPYEFSRYYVYETTYTDVAVTNGVAYYYVVVGVNSSGQSGYSNEDSATPIQPPPPPAPTGLIATSGDTLVSLSWSASAWAERYHIYRSTTPSGPYTNVTFGDVFGTSYIDYGDWIGNEYDGYYVDPLQNGVSYYYVVVAVNAAGRSGYSNEAGATPMAPLPPDAPTGLTATAGDATVSLSWDASAGATGYYIKRATTSGGPYNYGYYTNGTSYVDYGDWNIDDYGEWYVIPLQNGVTYYYVVVAVNSGDQSGYSNEANATPTGPPPAPTGLTASAGDSQVGLTWSASSGATGYRVKRATNSGGPYTVVGSTIGTGYTDTGLSNGATYYYVVSAVIGEVESSNSNEASATPVAPSPPAAPTGLTATGGTKKITLKWTQSSTPGVTENRIYRSTVSAGPFNLKATISATTTYVDTSLKVGVIYYYRVTAIRSGMESAYSNKASAKAR